MQIFNIGPLELIIILLIMFLLLGPKEMVMTAQRIGKWIRGVVRSPAWREIMGYSQEIRELPKKIMEDTGLEETLKEVRATTQQAAAEINTAVNQSMQEVRQSTQEAAAEMNQAVKESVEAARVPEAEHLRLDTETDQTIAPPEAVEAARQADSPEGSEELMAGPAVVETTEVGTFPESPAETADTGIPAVVEVPVAQGPDAETPKKPRRKRAQIAEEQAVPVEQASEPPPAETPQPARRNRARKAVSEAKDTALAGAEVPADLSVQAPTDVQLPADTAMADNGPETAAPKKRRAKRTAPEPEEKQDLD